MGRVHYAGPYVEDLFAEPLRMDKDGLLAIPDGPGLGFKWNEDGIAKHTGGMKLTREYRVGSASRTICRPSQTEGPQCGPYKIWRADVLVRRCSAAEDSRPPEDKCSHADRGSIVEFRKSSPQTVVKFSAAGALAGGNRVDKGDRRRGRRRHFLGASMHKTEPWRYEKLTWPEINDAVKQKKVVVVPIGSIEQHGPHLPLDVDMLEVTAIAQAAARLIPNDVLVLPTQVNGYTGHVMDFPGTINIHFETLIKFMIDIGKSLAYHGFKKIIYINGHGSNVPNMDSGPARESGDGRRGDRL